MSTSPWRIVEHRGRAGLQRLEADWRALYVALPHRSRYHAFEAQLAYLDHLCDTPELARYLALTEGRRVRAICPLVARDDTSLRYPLHVWALPWHPHWTITDVLCPDAEAAAALVPAAVRFLRASMDGRRLLVLGPLPQASAVWHGLQNMSRCSWSTHATEVSHCFDCQKPYDELMARLSKHFRRNVRSHCNKIARLEGARFATAVGEDILEGALEAFLSIEASGWKGQGGTGSAISLYPRLTAFYRALVATMVGPEDHCEINSLWVDDRCVAAQFCVRTGPDYAILKIGYDQDYARLGPGQVLLSKTLERCCADPAIKRLDLVTDTPWSRDWQPETIPMRQAHLALGRVAAPPLVGLIGARYGAARRAVRALRAANARRQKPPRAHKSTTEGS